MQVFSSKKSLAQKLDQLRTNNKSIGLVPTMGALHDGHLALVTQGLSENNVVVTSIFVNPTQFNQKEDLDKYPRTLERDVALLKTVSKDNIFVYAPSVDDIYGDHVVSVDFTFDGLEDEMEGKFREGHFDGVATIVKRLIEIVNPDKAYFGEKDFQQLLIIKKMVEKHQLPVKIIGCKIHRERNGLAMSSRNERLKPEYKMAAPFIYKILKAAKKKFGTKSAKKVSEWVENKFANHELLELEYFTIADATTLKPIKRKSNKRKYRAFIAAYADDIRLIDNVALN